MTRQRGQVPRLDTVPGSGPLLALVGPPAEIALTIFVAGHSWRWRTDQFGWTSRTTQPLESRLLRLGSPLCRESGLDPELRRRLLARAADGRLEVRNDQCAHRRHRPGPAPVRRVRRAPLLTLGQDFGFLPGLPPGDYGAADVIRYLLSPGPDDQVPDPQPRKEG